MNTDRRGGVREAFRRIAALSVMRKLRVRDGAAPTAAVMLVLLVAFGPVANASRTAGSSATSVRTLAAPALATDSASASVSATPSTSATSSTSATPSTSPSPSPSTSPSPSGTSSCANPIVCENQLPGTPPSVWDVGAGEGTTIQGFASPFSVNVGQSIDFKIETPATSYKIDIYRMGYYGGDGARLVASVTPNIAVSQQQPACNTNTVTGLVDCGNWGVSATWNVPAGAVSGVYFAHIYRADGTSDENQIPFVVTNNASTSGVVMMTSDETWQAYNPWGGYNLYSGNATGNPWCCSERL